MQSVIGIDVGTTSIKCSAILADGAHYDSSCDTPLVNQSFLNKQEISFSPQEIWDSICNLLLPIVDNTDNVIISVACQAPSLCFWNKEGVEVGISYLSYYGNSMNNDYNQRRDKTFMRLGYANRIIPPNVKSLYVSGLTGYIVYMLTGQLTLDSITAWELGIESHEDELNMQVKFKPHILSRVFSPLTKIPLNCADLKNIKGLSLVGTTDSAILPISVVPEFPDYYIYLGSWGSLLRTKIRSADSYKMQYHTGLLNNWLISTPNFINKVKANILELDKLFSDVKALTGRYSKIAICGGLALAKREYIQLLINTYFVERTVVFVPEKGGAFGACKLAELSK